MQKASCGGDLGQWRTRAGSAWRASRRGVALLVTSLLVGAAPGASAADGTWNGTSGDWTNTAIWDGGIVADGAGSTASFIATLAADATVTVDAPVTIGSITFTDSGPTGFDLTLAGNGSDAPAPTAAAARSGSPAASPAAGGSRWPGRQLDPPVHPR